MIFQAEGGPGPAHIAFHQRVDMRRDLRKAGWIVLRFASPAVVRKRADATQQLKLTAPGQPGGTFSGIGG
jgi:very-short-patch-repair endonuclease